MFPYFVSQPLEIKEQKTGDECTACAVASIAEDSIGGLVDPFFTYQKTSDGQFGVFPEKVCQSMVNDGFLLQAGGEPLKVFKGYSKPSLLYYFDTFGGIKDILLSKRKAVFSGCYWQPEWDKKKDGFVDSWYQDLKIFPHAFKVYGIVEKYGKICLVVQNSRGKNVGDKGIFYFPEEIVRKFSFAYYFN